MPAPASMSLRHVFRPSFAQRACEREQYRSSRERNDHAWVTYDMTARVHDQRFRRQQRFDLFEQQEPDLAARNQARRRRVQDERCAQPPPLTQGYVPAPRGALGPSQRSAPLSSAGGASRFPRPPARGRSANAGGKARRVEVRRAYALPRRGARSGAGAGPQDMRACEAVDPVAALFERSPHRVERFCRPAKIA